MNLVALCEGFGSEIMGVGPSNLTHDTFKAIHRAWLTLGVLRFTGQTLNMESLQTLSQHFGLKEQNPTGGTTQKQEVRLDNLYVTPISTMEVDSKPIGGLSEAEAILHADMTCIEVPPPAGVPLDVEIPQNGGATYFANQRAALASLPDLLRERVDGLSIKHDAAHDSVGRLWPRFGAFDDPRDAPGAMHPVIRKHNETADTHLCLGRRKWAYIPGLPLNENEALLDKLWSHAVTAGHAVKQNWTPGDVILWDNRRCSCKRTSIDLSQRRLLHRYQVLARAA